MTLQLSDRRWSDAQRTFVAALEAGGANRVEHAVPIDRVTPIPVRELQALVDAGIVREASANGYYVYPRQVMEEPLSGVVPNFRSPEYFATPPRTLGRFARTIVFWAIMMLIPILLFELLTRNGR